MRSIGRRRDWAPTEPPRRRYVASLIWPGRLPRPANDNRCGVRLPALVSLAAAATLFAAAVWAVVS